MCARAGARPPSRAARGGAKWCAVAHVRRAIPLQRHAWHLGPQLDGADVERPTDFLFRLLESLPSRPADSPVPKLRAWLAPKLDKSEYDSTSALDVLDVLYTPQARDLGVPGDKGAVLVTVAQSPTTATTTRDGMGRKMLSALPQSNFFSGALFARQVRSSRLFQRV